MIGAAPAIALGVFALVLFAARKPRQKTVTEVELELAGVSLKAPLAQQLLDLEGAFHTTSPELLDQVNAVRVQLGLEPMLIID